MELETLKSAFRATEFDGHLFDRPVPEIALDVEARVNDMTSKQRQRDIARIAALTPSLGLWFLFFDHRQPWWASVGVVLLIVGTALEIVCYVRLRFQDRQTRFDLPRRTFLIEERRKLAARLRIMGRDIAWSAVPLFGGALLYFLWPLKSVAEIALGIGLLAVAAILTYGTGLRRARRDVEALVRELDRDLADLTTL